MRIEISHPDGKLEGNLRITGSKSESNRVLILQALFPSISLENLSNSDDTMVLQESLKKDTGIIDIHHAGTAMRFLTAYYAAKENSDVILTGSPRMRERPVKLLVEALRDLGAEISYMENEGFPPIQIRGRKLGGSSVTVEANISSQYISALMLIAASLPRGLEIDLKGIVTSTPYINMTLELLQLVGIQGSFSANKIIIAPKGNLVPKTVQIESDWSSASYFFSLAAIADTAHLRLSNYRESSLQGDSCIVRIYKQLGISTTFEGNTVILKKTPGKKPRRIVENLQDSPDIAQTIAVTCLALGIECELGGLHTLKIKETDRLVALKTEMEKFGARVAITNDHLHLYPCAKLNPKVSVATYNDHRMAMAFAPLGLKIPVQIQDAGVVSKSYPEFWKHLELLGFHTS